MTTTISRNDKQAKCECNTALRTGMVQDERYGESFSTEVVVLSLALLLCRYHKEIRTTCDIRRFLFFS